MTNDERMTKPEWPMTAPGGLMSGGLVSGLVIRISFDIRNSSFVIRNSSFVIRNSSFGFRQFSSVALAHDEIERAQDADDVADHVTREQPGEDAEVDEGRGPDFEPVGRASAFAVDVETELALGGFGPEIDLAGRRVD